MTPLESLVACGTKLYLDSIDPDLVIENRQFGATGATSNPAIISGLIKTGRFDSLIEKFAEQGHDDEAIAWAVTDAMVTDAEQVFRPIYDTTHGNDGYVSFELDPLLEDPENGISGADRTAKYIELGKQYAADHPNRMIKVPGSEAGIAALEELAAAGVTLNVTLLFTLDQYRAARDAIWKGAQRRGDLTNFKSVYSIFISRIDVYTLKACPDLSEELQGRVGTINAKQVWRDNQEFWAAHDTPLQQEIIFASTGVKTEGDPPDLYVAALAGSDIQTNPPETNAAVQEMGKTYTRTVDQEPPAELVAEMSEKVDIAKMHETLMAEGVKKFTDPQNALLSLIREKREALVPA